MDQGNTTAISTDLTSDEGGTRFVDEFPLPK